MKFINIAGLFIVSIFLVGCNSEDDIDAFLKNPGVSPKKIEKLPQAKPFPGVSYDRGIVRDPFVPKSITLVVGDKNAPYKDEDKQILENFPLDGLQMIGFVNIDSKPYALIKDPEYQVHQVTIGSRLGFNYGKVVQISKNGIQLKESVQDNTGNWIEIDNVIGYTELDNVTSSGNTRRK